jgi:uncharacterized protein (DUF2249 family)
MSRRKTVRLDVREDIRAGREPFSKIMAATSALKDNEDLLLVAPFEPKPLFGVLAGQGFTHTAKELSGGDWEVLFTRPAPDASGKGSARPSRKQAIVEVDARDLEPPQPMVKILEALAALPQDAVLHARTLRRPLHLYPQIEARGFMAESTEQSDGSFLTVIRHA